MELLICGRFGNLNLTPKSTKLRISPVCLEANNETLFILDSEGNVHYSELKGTYIDLIQIPLRLKSISISCGKEHCALITDTRELYTWGNGDSGALGLGNTQSAHEPQKITFSRDYQIEKISCGGWHTLGLFRKHSSATCLLVFGRGNEGQLGTGRSSRELTPVKVELMESVCDISSGISHSAAIGNSGSLYTAGFNRFGQLGLGHKKNSYKFERVRLENVEQVSCGHHTAAISQGKLYIWGTGVFGEFLEPNLVSSVNESIVKVTVGECSGAAVDVSKKLWTWGSNTHGELGTGDLNPQPEPTKVLTSYQILYSVMTPSFSAVISKKVNLSSSFAFNSTKLTASSPNNVASLSSYFKSPSPTRDERDSLMTTEKINIRLPPPDKDAIKIIVNDPEEEQNSSRSYRSSSKGNQKRTYTDEASSARYYENLSARGSQKRIDTEEVKNSARYYENPSGLGNQKANEVSSRRKEGLSTEEYDQKLAARGNVSRREEEIIENRREEEYGREYEDEGIEGKINSARSQKAENYETQKASKYEEGAESDKKKRANQEERDVKYEMKKIVEENHILRQDFDALKQENENLRFRLLDTQSRVQYVIHPDAIEELKNENKALKETVNSFNEEQAKYFDIIGAERQEKESLEEILASVKEELETIKDENVSLNEENYYLNQKLEQLVQECNEKSSLEEILAQTKQEFESSSETLKNENAALSKENYDLNESLKQITIEKESLEDMLAHTKQEYESSLETLKKENISLSEENYDLHQRLEQLAHENHDILIKVADLEELLNNTNLQLCDSQSQTAALELKNEILQKQFQEAELSKHGLMETLERDLEARARDYKEKAISILSTPPPELEESREDTPLHIASLGNHSIEEPYEKAYDQSDEETLPPRSFKTNRRGLSAQHQLRISRSAAKKMKIDDDPFPELRSSSPLTPRESIVFEPKHTFPKMSSSGGGLEDIKNKVKALKKDKMMLQNEIHRYEKRFHA
ncbi:unnamed protein product [Blepharisma stoltei]|uniref:RCC1-like domain-containing protein n=1 Tax=Blepharisma stoltei TaxID=1481888 RepID=A0AAU9ITP2_9CILI|nr:unnamed protein product [Blepharisma stoltei]